MKIEQIKFDPNNANKHTKKGSKIVSNSIDNLGYGRSILTDKDDKTIAGNEVLKNAKARGANIIVVETDGTDLVVVKRTDMTIDSKQGREMAVADNVASNQGFNIDFEVIEDYQVNFDIDLHAFDIDEEMFNVKPFGDVPPQDPPNNNQNNNNQGNNQNNDPNEKGMKIILDYEEDDYYMVKERLKQIGGTPEGVFFNLLGLKRD